MMMRKSWQQRDMTARYLKAQARDSTLPATAMKKSYAKQAHSQLS